MGARDLIEFSVQRPYPYGRWFHIFTPILSFLVFAAIVIWAAASSGYETYPIMSPRYNLTDTNWYAKFLAGFRRNKPLCDPAIVGPGANFYTSVSLFNWQVGRNEQASTASLSGAAYTGEQLTGCEVASVTMAASLVTSTVVSQVVALCPASAQGNWSAWVSANHEWTFSFIKDAPVQNLTQTNMHLDRFIGNAALGLLGMLVSLKQTTELQPNATANLTTLQQELIGQPYDRKATVTLSCTNGPTGACQQVFDILRELSNDTLSHTFTPYHLYYFSVLSMALTQSVRWDFGNGRRTIFTNQAQIDTALRSSEGAPYLDPLFLDQYRDYLLNGTEFPLSLDDAPTESTMQTQYLCRVYRLKSIPALVLSVAGLSFSLFASFWAAYHIVCTTIGKKMGRYKHIFILPLTDDPRLVPVPYVSRGAETERLFNEDENKGFRAPRRSS